MTTELTLDSLASTINDRHRRALSLAGSALEYARECGQALNEAKGQVPHGAWQSWLANNCPGISDRQTQKYMQVERQWDFIAAANVDGLATIDGALARIAEQKPMSNAPPEAHVPEETYTDTDHSTQCEERSDPESSVTSPTLLDVELDTERSDPQESHPPAQKRDALKRPVPDQFIEPYETGRKLKQFIRKLNGLRTRIEGYDCGQGADATGIGEAFTHLKDFQDAVQSMIYHTECPRCHETTNRDCKLCSGAGWVPESRTCLFSDHERDWLGIP